MSRIVIEDCSNPAEARVVLECVLKHGCSYAIGRNPANDVYLDHPSISRLHAVVFSRDGIWTLHDPGSTKGVTNREGERVVTAALQDGQYLSIGPTRLWFREELPGEPRKSAEEQDQPEFTSILRCWLSEADAPMVQEEAGEQIFHCCMGQRTSMTVGSGIECDLSIPPGEMDDRELLFFKLNDTWMFSVLGGQAISGADHLKRSGTVVPDREYTSGPLKFSIFRAKLID